MAPRVPLHVESLEVLQSRYAAAIKDLINQADVLAGIVVSPSSQAQHIFDTKSGWRLIVSRERLQNGEVGVHFSASIHDPNKRRQISQVGPFAMLDEVVKVWREIAKTTRTATLVGVSEGGIPHFYVEQMQ